MLLCPRDISISRPIKSCITAIMGLSISLSASALTVSDDFQIDGFARVIAGYLDGADDHYFNGYNDEVTLQQESLFALQPTYSFNDSVSFTGQFIARSDDDSEIGRAHV